MKTCNFTEDQDLNKLNDIESISVTKTLCCVEYKKINKQKQQKIVTIMEKCYKN